jgi:hypothetical protein
VHIKVYFEFEDKGYLFGDVRIHEDIIKIDLKK